MFSPSLIALIWQSLVDRSTPHQFDHQFETEGAIVQPLNEALRRHLAIHLTVPRVPVVGRHRQTVWYGQFEPFATVTARPDGPGVFVHGRVPVDKLVKYFAEHYAVPSTVEFIDLGTKLLDAQVAGAGSSLGQCTLMMSGTGSQPVVDVAIIDRGLVRIGSAPNSFSGRLHHAVAIDVELDRHAVDVLAVLLDRLQFHHLLAQSVLHCALVPPPVAPIGLACFQHANSVELLDAVVALDKHLATLGSGRALSANLSLGTHVGPHDGSSPLEDFVRSHFAINSDRYMHVAAGNDGLQGVSAVRALDANIDEFVRLRVGPTGCTEVLVEIWWDAAAGGSMTAEVELSQLGVRMTVAPAMITSKSAGASMSPAGVTGGAYCLDLFHAACHGKRSCIAFSITAAAKPALANADIDIKLNCGTAAQVNLWLAVCEDPLSSFLASGTSASVRVPATDGQLIGVAGATAAGQPWAKSSRGPTASYAPGPGRPTPPYLAHLVDHPTTGDRGTSFASPRACADTARALVTGARAADAMDAGQMIVRMFGTGPGALAKPWDPRTGFGVVV